MQMVEAGVQTADDFLEDFEAEFMAVRYRAGKLRFAERMILPLQPQPTAQVHIECGGVGGR